MRAWNELLNVNMNQRLSEQELPPPEALARTLARQAKYKESRALIRHEVIDFIGGQAAVAERTPSPESRNEQATVAERLPSPESADYDVTNRSSDSGVSSEDIQSNTCETAVAESPRSPSRSKNKLQEGRSEEAPRPRRHLQEQPSASRSPSVTGRNRSRSPRRKSVVLRSRKPRIAVSPQASRSRGLLTIGTGRAWTDIQEGLASRPAINTTEVSSSQPIDSHTCNDPLPASVGQGNFMIANWAVGKDADAHEVGEKLKVSPFDCVVITMTSAVAENSVIAEFFRSLAEQSNARDSDVPIIREILQDQAVLRVSWRVYVLLHRAKISGCQYFPFSIRSRGTASTSESMDFGTLCLDKDTKRQRMERISIGILDAHRRVSASETEAIAEWILMERIAILTGHFGNNRRMVEDIAIGARAVFCEVLAQWMVMSNRPPQRTEAFAHPTYFVLFGYYRSIHWPCHLDCQIPDTWSLGDDLRDEMLGPQDKPTWPDNGEGSALVPHLGNIKMKKIDFARWCPNVIQTCLWLGTSTPSKKSQNRSRGKQDKGKGKGKGKGTHKGKATSKSKDKNIDPQKDKATKNRHGP